MVMVLDYLQFIPGSIAGLGVIHGWSFLVPYSALRGYFPRVLLFPPLLKKQPLILFELIINRALVMGKVASKRDSVKSLAKLTLLWKDNQFGHKQLSQFRRTGALHSWTG